MQMESRAIILAANEATYAYHIIKHRQSFKSTDKTAALLRQHFGPQFTCNHKKCEAIVLNVLYPHVLSKTLEEVKNCNFITVLFDTSNQREIKIMPVLIRYFHPKKGVRIKLLQMKSLGEETAEDIATYISDSINQSSLQTKVLAISANNINTNFGESKRSGDQNVLPFLERMLKTKLAGIVCSAHIIHNAIKVAADILPIDVEIIIGKIYQYFKAYTVRAEKLKAFRIFLDIEYQRTQGYTSTKWLAFLPVIERMLQIFEALRSYFLTCEKPPVTLKNFFNDPTSELWLLFIYSQSHLFQLAVQSLEVEYVSIGSAATTLYMLTCDLETRLKDRFLPLNVSTALAKLEDGEHFWKMYVTSKACEFYTTAVEYIKEWTSHLNEFIPYEWLELNHEIPSSGTIWPGVSDIIQRINDFSGIQLDDSKLYTQISEVRRFVNAAKLTEWTRASAGLSEKWINVFDHLNKFAIPSGELLIFTEYVLCLPGSNKSVERVHSRIFEIWTENKFQLNMQSLCAISTVDNNLNMTCKDFYKYISEESGLLYEIYVAGLCGA